VSIYFCAEPFQQVANDFMGAYGNRYFAFDLIYYFREQRDTYYCTENGHEKALYKLYERYPDMREEYLSAIVEGILDSDTKTFNRNLLIWNLKEVTGVDFKKMPERVRYVDMGPYILDGSRNVSDWWVRRTREKEAEAVAAMEADDFYRAATGTVDTGPGEPTHENATAEP